MRAQRLVLPRLFVLVVFAAPGQSFALDVYVSVDGGAQADGSLTNFYGSLPDAVEAVRALRIAGSSEPVVIKLREGRHQLNRTLVLGIGDGSPATSDEPTLERYGAGDTTGPAFLTFAACEGEHPVVSAGMPVTGWRRLESAPAELPAKAVGKVWVANMPTGMDRFYTLYITMYMTIELIPCRRPSVATMISTRCSSMGTSSITTAVMPQESSRKA